MAEISGEIKSGMQICLVSTMDEVIPLAFAQEIKIKKTRGGNKKKTVAGEQEK